ncbi:hypothetical protein AKJ52_02185 [candidate division MSBL1 archaeon SCGC-AAA382C18]|uniref:CBS domain-containing protein n=1 Tax=candidate division MSBL1 archaeon SCGC-AAA382C18 TaxID=1698281 RepID=A0A133VJ86_9EURY|nr:hypothetical protein AKJ52_02185 [candidate division MSBL1 archaeon SCGC-AAA382C18]
MSSELLGIKVNEIMRTEDIPLVERSDPIKEIMPFPHGSSHAWVLEGGGSKKVVGVVTEHDILTILAPDKPAYIVGFPDMRTLCADCPIGDIMTREIIETKPDERLDDALRKITKHRISCLPVLDKDGEIVGEIHKTSITDRLSDEFG